MFPCLLWHLIYSNRYVLLCIPILRYCLSDIRWYNQLIPLCEFCRAEYSLHLWCLWCLYHYYLLSYVYTSEELWVPLLVIVIVYFVLKRAIFLALWAKYFLIKNKFLNTLMIKSGGYVAAYSFGMIYSCFSMDGRM